MYCFDYATEAACDGFDTTPTTDSALYALRADPNNPTCIWYNSDPGKIGLFDAYHRRFGVHRQPGRSRCSRRPSPRASSAPRAAASTGGSRSRSPL